MGDAFYNESGQVTNEKRQARELADLEANTGRNAALAREKELKRITEGGLSDEETNNVAIMNGVKEKYPDAFDCTIDSKGREFLKIRWAVGFVKDNPDRYFTQHGLLQMGEHVERYLKREEVVDKANEVARTPQGNRGNMWQILDLTDEKVLENLKGVLGKTQEGERIAKAGIESKSSSSLAQNVLAKL